MNQDRAEISPYAMEVSNLSVVLGGQKVLDIPSLQLLSNEVLVAIGPNGAGKTTLLLSLALLLRPASGTISYWGQPVGDNGSILRMRRRFAVVFQEALLLNTTVAENVSLGLRLRGVSRGEVKARTEKWLERFGISALASRQAKTLSGGEAKRASLARAFALEPEILFLDEPFAALDSPTHQALLEDMETILREARVTTVMVTHDRGEALTLADRVAVLMDGHVRQLGSPQEVFSSPADEDVAGFVGMENVLSGLVIAQTNGLASISLCGQQIDAVCDLPSGSKVMVGLRPEDTTLSMPSAETMPTSARNRLRGRIAKMSRLGSQMRITVDCGFPLVTLITQRSREEMALEVGQEVIASFKASIVHSILRH